MITLYHLNRSRSLRIIWMVEELGQNYELVKFERDKNTSFAPPELREIHPLGKAPILELDGRLITESAAIVEVLASRFAPEMIPEAGSDPYFQHLELMHFAEGSVMTPILLGLYLSRLGKNAAPLQPRVQAQLTSHYAYMESILRPSGHFVLDRLSAVDIMLSFPASIAMRQNRAAEFPKIAAFMKHIERRDAYQRALKAAGE